MKIESVVFSIDSTIGEATRRLDAFVRESNIDKKDIINIQMTKRHHTECLVIWYFVDKNKKEG